MRRRVVQVCFRPWRTALAAALLFAWLCSFPVVSAVGQSAATPVQDGVSVEAAQKLMDSGQFRDAALSLLALLKADPNARRAHQMLGYTYLRLNDPKNSLSEYTLAAQVARPAATDLQNVAKDYVLLGDLASAEHWMLVSVQTDPSDPEGWYGLGRIRFTQQRFGEAVESFTHVLRLAPRSVKAENNLGLSYEGLNQPAAAEQAYRLAVDWGEKDANPSEQPLLNLGTLLGRQEKLDEAVTLLERAVQIAPHEPRTREQLGHVYLQMGKLPQAEEQLTEALKLEPMNSTLHFLLGRVYHQEGHETNAKNEFAAASSLTGYRSTPEKY